MSEKNRNSYFKFGASNAPFCLVNIRGREQGIELGLCVLYGFGQYHQHLLQQQSSQSSLLLHVQNGLCLPLQQPITLLLSLPEPSIRCQNE